MSTVLRNTKAPEEYFLDIIFQDESGWHIQLPQQLIEYQSELEQLIQKVFGNRPKSNENLNLARQLSINWFCSKCKQSGIEPEDCF